MREHSKIKFRETLRWMRKEAKLSQKDVAEKIGYVQTAVSKWEVGAAEPPFDAIERLADLFGVLPGDMLNGMREE